MSDPGMPLAGTEPLAVDRRTAFADRYTEQYALTLAWMRSALARASQRRDSQRSTDRDWLRDKRARLAHLTGAVGVPRGPARAELEPATNAGGRAYRLCTEAGLVFSGTLWDPPSSVVRGVVLLGGQAAAASDACVEGYRRAGLRVIAPALARAERTFVDHPDRRWYAFGDDEVLHLFLLIVGGSLAGLEAAELAYVIASLARTSDDVPLPVLLDMRGRHVLTSAVAAALYPELVTALVLSDDAERLDHQERDVRVNTIWGFHTDFDALTLCALAEDSDLVFVDPTRTPSTLYSRAAAWLDGAGGTRRVHRLRGDVLAEEQRGTAVAECLAGRLAAPSRVADCSSADNARDWNPSLQYREATESKLSFVEALHTEARERRTRRYDLATLTAAEYRERIDRGLEVVMGPPLPETSDRRVRTRHVESRPQYDIYELVLEAVPQIDTCAYLLLPNSGLPAPAVICQHGRGGRPEALAGLPTRIEPGEWIYDQFARRLADKGYVVLVPFMNWGWGTTPARDALVKRAYALGITPNRFEVAQLHACVDFLQSRAEVLSDRIAFYGLSYGGHASLWLGVHEPRLAAVITSGFFNEFQRKLVGTDVVDPFDTPNTFISVDEGYDMFTYDLLNEFGLAELATRWAPRPYMVEHGLRDAAGPTTYVEQEFERVRRVYAWSGAPHNAVLAHFDGAHRVWSEDTFPFLHRHLRRERT